MHCPQSLNLYKTDSICHPHPICFKLNIHCTDLEMLNLLPAYTSNGGCTLNSPSWHRCMQVCHMLMFSCVFLVLISNNMSSWRNTTTEKRKKMDGWLFSWYNWYFWYSEVFTLYVGKKGPSAPAVWLGAGGQLSIKIHLKALRQVCWPAEMLPRQKRAALIIMLFFVAKPIKIRGPDAWEAPTTWKTWTVWTAQFPVLNLYSAFSTFWLPVFCPVLCRHQFFTRSVCHLVV